MVGVVLISTGVREFALLHRVVVDAGLTPVGYLMSRSLRARRAADGHAASAVEQVVRSVPGSVDLVLPADAAGVGRALRGLDADLVVMHGFDWILPRAVFSLPRLGVLNVHTSALPAYRGPAPVLWAIRRGDPTLGVTVHRVDDGVDTGPVLARETGVPLDDDVSPESLRARLEPVIARLVRVALDRAVAGDPGEPQGVEGASRAGFLEPGFARVDWGRPAREVHDQVRVFRFMGSTTAPVAVIGGREVRLVRTRLTPGSGVRVECADGPLWIVEAVSAR
ncbi:formyltransferase family protein [Actinosynnema sp. NPDC020468]|uniref:methionyl-tRNA formyltransferase n=1 Tax=Actinosynnema sp. NPDC020468 TaxID=3154488 RepID=UPI00340B01CB